MNEEFLNTLSSIIGTATPLVIASLGETITERAGVVNLSLDGSLALAAVTGFAAAWTAQEAGVLDLPAQLAVGIAAAMLVGAFIALLVGFSSIKLRRDQVAVGFVLTLLAADLARFLGADYTRIPGPQITRFAIPLLEDIPVLGIVFFQQNLLVYFSYFLMFIIWFWLFRTRGGLALRAIGERPEAAYARGAPVQRLRYWYTGLGGALVGLAGAAYSLNVKPGWSSPPAMQGDGWIALAIVIFGGWHPFRVVLGAYLVRRVARDLRLYTDQRPLHFRPGDQLPLRPAQYAALAADDRHPAYCQRRPHRAPAAVYAARGTAPPARLPALRPAKSAGHAL